MADSWLTAVEKRIEILENRVFGSIDKDAEFPKVKEEDQCIDSLANVQKKVKTAVAKKPKLGQSLSKLNEVDKYLDPGFSEDLTLSNGAKADIILAEEDYLRQQAENLEKLQKTKSVLDSEHIKVVPALQKKFHDLSQLHIQNQDETSGLTEEIKALLLQYNTIITLLSKQFVQWDEVVTRVEIAARPKKEMD